MQWRAWVCILSVNAIEGNVRKVWRYQTGNHKP